MAYSRPFERALMLAAIVHEGEPRKGTIIPYVIHPFHVAMILARHGLGEALQIAGVLHDVLEDVKPEHEQMRKGLGETFSELKDAPEAPAEFLAVLERTMEKEFGREVMTLVRGVTDRKKKDGKPLGTLEKRRIKLAELRRPGTPVEVLALKAADALHNASTLVNDLQERGLSAAHRFKVSPAETVRWYAQIHETIAPRLGQVAPALLAELRAVVEALKAELVARMETEEEAVQRLEGEFPLLFTRAGAARRAR